MEDQNKNADSGANKAPESPKKHLSKKVLLGGLAGLIVVAGALAYGLNQGGLFKGSTSEVINMYNVANQQNYKEMANLALAPTLVGNWQIILGKGLTYDTSFHFTPPTGPDDHVTMTMLKVPLAANDRFQAKLTPIIAFQSKTMDNYLYQQQYQKMDATTNYTLTKDSTATQYNAAPADTSTTYSMTTTQETAAPAVTAAPVTSDTLSVTAAPVTSDTLSVTAAPATSDTLVAAPAGTTQDATPVDATATQTNTTNLQLAPSTFKAIDSSLLKLDTSKLLLPATQTNLLMPEIAKASPLPGTCTVTNQTLADTADAVNLYIDCLQPDSVTDGTQLYEFTLDKTDAAGTVSNLLKSNMDGKWGQVATFPVDSCQNIDGYVVDPQTVTHTLGDTSKTEAFTLVPSMGGTALKVDTTKPYDDTVICNSADFTKSLGVTNPSTDLQAPVSGKVVLALDLRDSSGASAFKPVTIEYPFSSATTAWDSFITGKDGLPNTLSMDFSKVPSTLKDGSYTLGIGLAGTTKNYMFAKLPITLNPKPYLVIGAADPASDSVTLTINDTLGIDKTSETYVGKCYDASGAVVEYATASTDPKVTVSGLAASSAYTCQVAVAPTASYKDEKTWTRVSKQFDITTKVACIKPASFGFDPKSLTYTIGDLAPQTVNILPLDSSGKVLSTGGFDICADTSKAMGFDNGMFFSIEGKYADPTYSSGVKVDPKAINAWGGFVAADPASKTPTLTFDFTKAPVAFKSSDYVFNIYGNSSDPISADVTGLVKAGVTPIASLPLSVVEKMSSSPAAPVITKSALVISKIDTTENTATVTVTDKDGLDAGQKYGINCYVSTDEKNFQVAYDDKPVLMVGKLLSNTKYTCEAAAVTPSVTGGYSWSRNSAKVETQTKVSAADLSKADADRQAAEKYAADLAAQLAAKQRELDSYKALYANYYNSYSTGATTDSTQLDSLKKQLSDTQNQVNDLRSKLKTDTTVTASSQSAAATSGGSSSADCSVGDVAFQKVCSRGIITDFRPNVLIKRFEYALSLYRLSLNLAPNSKVTQALYSCTGFKDYTNFSKEEWSKELCDSVKMGIIRGYQKTSTFEPSVNISYVEHYRALYQLYLALGLTDNLSQSDLKDAVTYLRSADPNFTITAENRWYVEAVQFAIKRLSLVPAKDVFTTATRGEITNDLYQLIK